MAQRYAHGDRDVFLSGCKVYDFAFSQPLTPAPGFSAVYSLVQIPRGRDDGQRIGREILVRRILLRYYTTAHQTDPTGPYVRTVVFHDKQFAGVNVPPATVLQSNTITAFQNKYYRDRFNILHDDTYTMSLTNWSGGLDYQHLNQPLMEVVLDLDLIISYTSANGADIRGNNIAMVMPVVSAVNLTQFTCQARVFYEDR